MSCRTRLCFFVAWFWMVSILGHAADSINAKPTEDKTPVATIPLLTTGAYKCDSSGNVFLRPYDPRGSNSFVNRYSRDGKSVARLAPTGSSINGFTVSDYAVNSAGVVEFLLNSVENPSVKIAQLDQAGETVKTIGLRLPPTSDYLRGDALGLFSSGRFLVVGIVRYGQDAQPEPFFGVFESTGAFLSDLYYPSASNAAPKLKFRFRGMSSDDAVQAGLSVMQASGDKLYLLESGTADSQILEIDDSGRIQRGISMQMSGYTPNDFFVQGASAVAEFLGDRGHSGSAYLLVQLDRGQIIHLSARSLDEAGRLTCYEPGGVATFVHATSFLRMKIP